MLHHTAQCVLAYRPEQLFDLVADVERYPEYLPGWIAARVREREGNVYFTDQVVGFGAFRERFGSRTVLHRPDRIEVTSTDNLFRSLSLTWDFGALPGDWCRVELFVDLKLRSGLVDRLFRRTAIGTPEAIMSAFVRRAHHVYGSPDCQ